MTNILLTVAGTVVVLNIIYIFIPDGKYEKYIRPTAGLIVILTVVRLLFGIEISSDVLDFTSYAAEKQSMTQLEETLEKQTEQVACDKINRMLAAGYTDKAEAVWVDIADNVITAVGVRIYDESVRSTVCGQIAAYCDININSIVIE